MNTSTRAEFEAWCDRQYGNQAYLHKSTTCGEWDAWQAAWSCREPGGAALTMGMPAMSTDKPAPHATVPMVADPTAVQRHLRELRAYLKASELGGIKDEWVAALDALGVQTPDGEQR